MQSKTILLVIQSVVFGYIYTLRYVEALIGADITQARNEEFSSVVCLIKDNGSSELQQNIWCSGTLITYFHIATAEHCVNEIQSAHFLVVAGSVNLLEGKNFHPLWWLTYANWATSHNIIIRYTINDIAVIKLFKKVSIRNRVITPAMISSIPNEYLYGKTVVIAGWGLTNTGNFSLILQTVNIKIISLGQCMYLALQLEKKRVSIPESMLCTIKTPYSLTDDGDSGGPLFYNNVLVGVNIGNCPNLNNQFHPRKANVHSSIASYRDFINAALI